MLLRLPMSHCVFAQARVSPGSVLHGTNFKTFSRLNFVANFVASFVVSFVVSFVENSIETTTKEPAFAASGRLSTKLATKKTNGNYA
jgi:mannitol-specific phosphotransferase system IIBC component